MLGQAPRHRPIAWLLAYAQRAPDGAAIPIADLKRNATTLGPAGARALGRLEALGLLQREDGRIRLASEYLPHRGYFVRQVQRLANAVRALDRTDDEDQPTTALRRGIILFNAGLFFESHEYLEGVWRATAGPDRNFYHGLIQVAAAFYHFEKGNQHGARTLLGKAVSKLEPYRPRHLGVDVDRLLVDLQPWGKRFAAKKAGVPLNTGDAPAIAVRATM